jgi:alpha-L-fucosidase
MPRLHFNRAVTVFIVAVFCLFAENAAAATTIYDLKKDFVNMRFAMFLHFNMATFENKNGTSDYGSGNANPAFFNPTGLNCGQWAAAAKTAKMTAGCLTVKHHDGFCVYNSAYSTYDVGTTGPDVVKAYTDAFRAAGLKPGLYYSMWDFHENIANGTCTAAKKQFIKNQLGEILSNYGAIPFIVFDGWNAPWGGPNYDELPYEEISAYVKSIQPNCLLVNISCEPNETHTDVVMFENGAGQFTPSWFVRAGIDCYQLQQGYWFWKTTMPTGGLNTVDFVVNQHLKPLNAQNQVYILNCAPGTTGTLDQNVVTRLAEIGNTWTVPPTLDTIPSSWYPSYDVTKNLAYGKPSRQSSTLAGYNAYSVRALDGYTDGDFFHASVSHTDSTNSPWWQVDLGSRCTISSVELWNRTDLVMNRLSNYWVLISNNPFSDADSPTSLASRSDVWKVHNTTYPNPSATISVPDYSGRYVRIQLDGKSFLALAEVKVFGGSVTAVLGAYPQPPKASPQVAPTVFSLVNGHCTVPKQFQETGSHVCVYDLSGRRLGAADITGGKMDFSRFSKGNVAVIVAEEAARK